MPVAIRHYAPRQPAGAGGTYATFRQQYVAWCELCRHLRRRREEGLYFSLGRHVSRCDTLFVRHQQPPRHPLPWAAPVAQQQRQHILAEAQHRQREFAELWFRPLVVVFLADGWHCGWPQPRLRSCAIYERFLFPRHLYLASAASSKAQYRTGGVGLRWSRAGLVRLSIQQ